MILYRLRFTCAYIRTFVLVAASLPHEINRKKGTQTRKQREEKGRCFMGDAGGAQVYIRHKVCVYVMTMMEILPLYIL